MGNGPSGPLICPRRATVVENGALISPVTPLRTDGGSVNICFTDLAPVEPLSKVKINFSIRGDFSASFEYVSVFGDDREFLGRHQGGGDCDAAYDTRFAEIDGHVFNDWIASGGVNFRLETTRYVDDICSFSDAYIELEVVPQMHGYCSPNAFIQDSSPSTMEMFNFDMGYIDFCWTSGLPYAHPLSLVIIKVATKGDFNFRSEYVSVIGDGGEYLGKHDGGRYDCESDFTEEYFVVSGLRYNKWLMSGALTIRLETSENVDDRCAESKAFVTIKVPKTAATMGDPHFQTWSDNWYDFHGICDLVLLQNPTFDNNKGMDIHVRTKPRYQYSYIEAAAIRIGEDVLEVGSFGQMWFNGVESADLTAAVMGGKFAVSHPEHNKKHHKYVITIDEEGGEALVIRTFKDLVSVTVENATMANFGGSSGMMGGYDYYGALLGRDGATIMEDASLFGQEWQVTSGDAQLFQSPSNTTGVCAPPTISEESRRLGESTIEKEAAEEACGHLEGKFKDMCVFDVLAMNDIEVASSEHFSSTVQVFAAGGY